MGTARVTTRARRPITVPILNGLDLMAAHPITAPDILPPGTITISDIPTGRPAPMGSIAIAPIMGGRSMAGMDCTCLFSSPASD